MTRRRIHSKVDQTPHKAAGLTLSQARVILSFEDASVRDAVKAGGLLLFPEASPKGLA